MEMDSVMACPKKKAGRKVRGPQGYRGESSDACAYSADRDIHSGHRGPTDRITPMSPFGSTTRRSFSRPRTGWRRPSRPCGALAIDESIRGHPPQGSPRLSYNGKSGWHAAFSDGLPWVGWPSGIQGVLEPDGEVADWLLVNLHCGTDTTGFTAEQGAAIIEVARFIVQNNGWEPDDPVNGESAVAIEPT